ncbi:twin-arginine translocation signal domain-containing protein [Chitinophagaceae bacterium 26-R-25]|nr:twin-arginine translocation signal domain-containing protein [Chitinophagaceae bacterium 26-R-25]
MASRRKFLKLTAGGILALGAGYVGVKSFSPFRKVIIDILYEDLKGLKIKQGDIEKFADKAAEVNPWHFNAKKQKLMAAYGPIKWMPLPFKKEYKLYRDDVVSRFLLSTDFFTNKMDESKEIAYMGAIWGPYSTPCLNPFSSMFYNAA